MKYKVCFHLDPSTKGKSGQDTRNVLLLSKDGERVLCCADCFESDSGTVLVTVSAAYLSALVTECSLLDKSQKVN